MMKIVSISCITLFCLLSLFPCRYAAAQMYSPAEPYYMWDTWVCNDKEGEYQLFYLESQFGSNWNLWYRIGRASSRDLLHWQPRESIFEQVPEGAWGKAPYLTGCTIPTDTGYACFIGAGGQNGGQEIGVLFSPDLETWQQYPGNPVLVSRKPYYGGEDWRDLSVYYDAQEKLWHGYLCARTAGSGAPVPPDTKDETQIACIARVKSKNLTEWEYLPPIFASPKFLFMEVPEYFQMNGRHYLIFSCARSRKDTSGRKDASGTWYVMADSREGPYRIPEQPLLLGSGQGRMDNYVGRTLLFGDTRLLYHHTVHGWLKGCCEHPVTWGIPKVIRQSEDGTLWLGYWPNLNQLETSAVITGFDGVSVQESMGKGVWTTAKEKISCRSPEQADSILWLPYAGSHSMITCTLRAQPAQAAGIVFRWDGERGTGLILEEKTDSLALVQIKAVDHLPVSELIDHYQGLGMADHPQNIRLLIHSHRVEVYVNDRWFFSTSILDAPAQGRVGLLVRQGTAEFSGFRMAELESLPAAAEALR